MQVPCGEGPPAEAEDFTELVPRTVMLQGPPTVPLERVALHSDPGSEAVLRSRYTEINVPRTRLEIGCGAGGASGPSQAIARSMKDKDIHPVFALVILPRGAYDHRKWFRAAQKEK